MDNDAIRDVIKRLVEHVENRTADYADSTMTVDSALYHDAEVAEREKTKVFQRLPVVVGHISEISEPGQFLTVDIMDTPILVIRQDDGSIQAFSNICRHRGARVEDQPTGRRKMFACPYHKWCYNRDGSLRSVPFDDGFAGLDRSVRGLQPLPTTVEFGLIWVVPTPQDGLDLDAAFRRHLGSELIRQLDGFDIASTWMFRQKTFDVPINWKVVLEGYLDAYHLQFVHPETVGPFFHTNVYTFEPHNQNGRILVARRDIQDVYDKDPDTFNFRRYVATNYTIYPSTVIVPAPQHFEIWTIVPHHTDASRCTVFLRMLAPFSDAVEKQNRYLEKNWELLCFALQEEDWKVSGTIMPGARSGHVPELVLGRNEAAIQHFHRALLADIAFAGHEKD